MICKRCKGSGNLLRRILGKLKAKTCTNCRGIGIKANRYNYKTLLNNHLKELEALCK